MSRIKGEQVNIGDSYVMSVDNNLSDFAHGVHILSGQMEGYLKQIEQNALNEAAKIVEEAKQRAILESSEIVEKIKENARQEAYKEGYEKGYTEGFQEGKTNGYQEISKALKDEFSQKVQDFNNFIKIVTKIKHNAIKSLHVEITQIIIQIANKICHRSFNDDNEIIKKSVSYCISKLSDKENIIIFINPYMNQRVKEVLDFAKSENNLTSEIKLIEDVNLPEDGIIVDSGDERYNVSFSSRLNEVLQKIFEQSERYPDAELYKEYEENFKEVEVLENKIIESVSGEQIIDELTGAIDQPEITDENP